MPKAKLGVIAVTSVDGANAVTNLIAEHALKLMLAVRNHAPLPRFRFPEPVSPALAKRLAGSYDGNDEKIDLIAREGRLFLSRREFLFELKALADTLLVDDRLAHGLKILPMGDSLRIGAQTFRRVAPMKPIDIPEHWRGLIGAYGWEHNVLGSGQCGVQAPPH